MLSSIPPSTARHLDSPNQSPGDKSNTSPRISRFMGLSQNRANHPNASPDSSPAFRPQSSPGAPNLMLLPVTQAIANSLSALGRTRGDLRRIAMLAAAKGAGISSPKGSSSATGILASRNSRIRNVPIPLLGSSNESVNAASVPPPGAPPSPQSTPLPGIVEDGDDNDSDEAPDPNARRATLKVPLPTRGSASTASFSVSEHAGAADPARVSPTARTVTGSFSSTRTRLTLPMSRDEVEAASLTPLALPLPAPGATVRDEVEPVTLSRGDVTPKLNVIKNNDGKSKRPSKKTVFTLLSSSSAHSDASTRVTTEKEKTSTPLVDTNSDLTTQSIDVHGTSPITELHHVDLDVPTASSAGNEGKEPTISSSEKDSKMCGVTEVPAASPVTVTGSRAGSSAVVVTTAAPRVGAPSVPIAYVASHLIFAASATHANTANAGRAFSSAAATLARTVTLPIAPPLPASSIADLHAKRNEVVSDYFGGRVGFGNKKLRPPKQSKKTTRPQVSRKPKPPPPSICGNCAIS